MYRFRLELTNGEPADPAHVPEHGARVAPGDTIPLPGRTLRVANE